MKHRAAPGFWESYRRLPVEIQRTGDRAFELLKADPHHPSPAVRVSDALLWFWIGTHAEYDVIIG